MRGSVRNPIRNRTVGAAAALLGALGSVSIAAAQTAPELPQLSPRARVEQQVGVTKLAVDYSSPAKKGRVIWGELVPYGELWRTGANAATKLEASRDFTFGGKKVAAGTYSLLSIPGDTSWTVILNSKADLPGTRGYDEKQDVARVTVKPQKAPARERMTFLFADTTDNSTRLDLEWDELRVSVPIEVATDQFAAANIDKALDDAWRPHFASARYLLDSGGDLDKALSYIDTSITIEPTWWNNWVRAQILAKKGRANDAVAAAEKAQELGKGDEIFEGFFKESVSKAIADWK
jgi:hypothetical protein